ncbi:hypothetical protein GCM10025782_23130 [Pedococcus ginsenosidimutans]|uniref:Uncharacterized protein n=1 Tax=Pedococcus ginsenosidimutans TaxID=490570 RepID=A0ABP8YAJ3_9MICO
MTENTTAKPAFKVKAGGSKGQAITELLVKEPGLSRAAIAERVGCTVGRVGETIRFLAAEGSKEEKAAASKHVTAQAKAREAAKRETEKKRAAEKAAKAKAKAAAPKK